MRHSLFKLRKNTDTIANSDGHKYRVGAVCANRFVTGQLLRNDFLGDTSI